MRQLMENLDASVATLITAIEDMKPAYQHALRVLSTSGSNADGGPGNAQKNNLVFYGLPPEPLERQMEAEPEFCRDILETRIKTVFREHLKISRDIPFTHVYRSILIFGNCAFFALLCMNFAVTMTIFGHRRLDKLRQNDGNFKFSIKSVCRLISSTNNFLTVRKNWHDTRSMN